MLFTLLNRTTCYLSYLEPLDPDVVNTEAHPLNEAYFQSEENKKSIVPFVLPELNQHPSIYGDAD
jgi:hypothetical protein